MNKKIAFIFPGQGAQYPGMGKDFYDSFAIVRETFEEADDILGQNFTKLILEGPAEELMKTKNSQLAIFIVSAAIFRCIQQQRPDLQPIVCAGLSLGEYTALFASGKLSFAEALNLVRLRAQFMNDACEKTSGTMRVVLGLEEEGVAKALPEGVWIANLNCPGQVVIAGETAKMPQTLPGAKRIIPLDVSGAFHTPLMRTAQERLKPYIDAAALQESPIQLAMNVPGDFVESIDEIRKYLIQQVANPTRWEKEIRAMMQKGIELFIEIGPGKTLTGMNKKIGAAGLSIETASELGEVYATT